MYVIFIMTTEKGLNVASMSFNKVEAFLIHFRLFQHSGSHLYKVNKSH